MRATLPQLGEDKMLSVGVFLREGQHCDVRSWLLRLLGSPTGNFPVFIWLEFLHGQHPRRGSATRRVDVQLGMVKVQPFSLVVPPRGF